MHIHSECVILTAFPLQQGLRKRASLLPYTYVACLVLEFVLYYHKCTTGSSHNFLCIEILSEAAFLYSKFIFCHDRQIWSNNKMNRLILSYGSAITVIILYTEIVEKMQFVPFVVRCVNSDITR
jgi:hypothetical protein